MHISQFNIGDIYTYISKKGSIEFVKVLKIKKSGAIMVQRLGADLENFIPEKIQLTAQSNWQSFVKNVDTRWKITKFFQRIFG